MNDVCDDYKAGLWVPSYYGNRFTVACKNSGIIEHEPAYRLAGRDWPACSYPTEIDRTFIVNTLAEAQAECEWRNR